MRIKRRTNGHWYAVHPDHGLISLRTKDREQAIQRAADLERAPKGDSVAAIMDAYLEYKSDKPGIAGMKDAWSAAKSHFGPLRADQITRGVCKAYILKRAGRSNGTIIKEIGTVRSGLRWHDKNTPAQFEFPKTPQARDSYITKDDFLKMYAATKVPHIKVFLALAWYTAARKESLLELTWDRCNVQTGKIRLGADVGNKGRAAVTPMAPALQAILEEALRGAVSNYVVEYAGDKVGDIKKGFAAAVKAAGLVGITPHDMRRSAGRHMVENGVPIEEVSQIMGHSSIETTRKHYAQYSPDFLRRAVSAL